MKRPPDAAGAEDLIELRRRLGLDFEECLKLWESGLSADLLFRAAGDVLEKQTLHLVAHGDRLRVVLAADTPASVCRVWDVSLVAEITEFERGLV